MKQKLFVAIGLTVVIAAFVLVMMLGDSKPSTFEVKDGDLVIGGLFGVTVPLSGITYLELTETPPQIGTRTNGSGVGQVYKGEFTVGSGIAARLYIDANKPPFITFIYNGTLFYINTAAPEETQALYDALSGALK